MRPYFVFVCVVVLASLALAQSPAKPSDAPGKIAESPLPSGVSVDPKLKDMFEAKIKAEWEALKNKDKKGYAELLDDDYQGVEVDGKGERNKTQAINELTLQENSFNYTLWGYKLIPLGPDAVLVIYESTLQFPPTAQMRYSRCTDQRSMGAARRAMERVALSGNTRQIALNVDGIHCNRCYNWPSQIAVGIRLRRKGGTLMSKLIFALLLSSSFLLAQDNSSEQEFELNGITLQGCVSRSSGDYVLMKQDPGVNL